MCISKLPPLSKRTLETRLLQWKLERDFVVAHTQKHSSVELTFTGTNTVY